MLANDRVAAVIVVVAVASATRYIVSVFGCSKVYGMLELTHVKKRKRKFDTKNTKQC